MKKIHKKFITLSFILGSPHHCVHPTQKIASSCSYAEMSETNDQKVQEPILITKGENDGMLKDGTSHSETQKDWLHYDEVPDEGWRGALKQLNEAIDL